MRIGVVGGLNMDIHLFGVREYLGQAPLVAEHYLVQPGGKGANQARAAARLGADVVLVGRVGDDEFGRACVAAAAGDGVDTRFVAVSSEVRTGFVVIDLPEGRHRSIVFAPGANDGLTWNDLVPALVPLAAVDVLVVQAEVPPRVLSRLLDWADEAGVPLLLDPVPPERVPVAAVRRAEAITPDEAEAHALTGRSLEAPAAPLLAAQDLVRAGARRVFLKVGESGVIHAEPGHIVRIPTIPVEAADETGAGDVFIAALAIRTAQGATWGEAARFANAAAALSVAAPGLALPTLPEVEEALARLTAPDEELPLG